MQIYKITNTINGKIYIGKDTTDNPLYLGSGKLIKLSIKKYGKKNFKKEIIEECDDYYLLSEREMYWIDFYNSTDLNIGYNISKGGDGGDTLSNNPNLNIIKEKISNKMKKRVFSDEHKKNLSKNHNSTVNRKGKTYEEIYNDEFAKEYKKKLSESRRKYKNEKERLGENYEKVINILKEKMSGKNNPMSKKTYLWYYNPETMIQKRIPDDCEIPDGFIRGRLSKTNI
jgi:6-pyruvoyl-tetrahydropterin synthase